MSTTSCPAVIQNKIWKHTTSAKNTCEKLEKRQANNLKGKKENVSKQGKICPEQEPL